MKLINFELDAPYAVHLIVGDKFWDLHNSFSFIGLTYSAPSKSSILQWDGIDVQTCLSVSISLTFNNLSSFIFTERDTELPLSEDTCLSYVLKKSQEVRIPGPSSPTDMDGDGTFHLRFCFQSGRFIEINAESVELSTQALAG